MNNRRDFIKTGLAGAGAMALAPQIFAQPVTSKGFPHRFIFIHRGNGVLPESLVPLTFSDKDKQADKAKEKLEIDLDKHELPDWLKPIAKHQKEMTILQGVSGKMCTTGHHSWCSSLGAYKANERISSILWATVDFELAKLFPSPMDHIEFACFPNGGGNARGNIEGIEKGFSAKGTAQPNYAFGSPAGAVEEIFKVVAKDKDAQIQYELQKKILEFRQKKESGLAADLLGLEKLKLQNYANSLGELRERNKRIEAMKDTLVKYQPKLDKKFYEGELTTVDRQWGHADVLLSTVISGLTNVAAFTIDELGTPYTGLPGMEKEVINMHDVGHGKPVGKVDAIQVRNVAIEQHMKVVNHIVEKLKAAPEGSGSIFDNTTIFYFPDGGETHHSHGWEFPFVILSGKNTKMDWVGRYIRLPYHGRDGHKTLGNLWTTLLNAYGNPIEHFGAMDVDLRIDQKGRINQFFA